MSQWLKNTKEKISDWYYDGDRFYLRTIVDPVIDLAKEVGSLGLAASETITPVYSDVMAASNIFDKGLADFKSGQYLKGSAEMVGAPLLGAALIAVPDGMDSPIKAVSKLDEPLYIYTGKLLGEKAGRGRPASNINDATGKPITMLDVIDAIRNNGRTTYEGTTEETIQSMAKRLDVDKKAGYHTVIQSLDRKWTRKKDPSDAKRSMYLTKARTGQLVKSDKPKVTEYLEEELAANFNPSKLAIKKNNFDRARQEWMDYLDELGYDIVTKESIKAADNIALNTWGKRFSILKDGGSINYILYFS